MGSFSFTACSPSAGEPAGLRMVATTWCPARDNSSAVAKPIPRLAPVITILAIALYRMWKQVLPGSRRDKLGQAPRPAAWQVRASGGGVVHYAVGTRHPTPWGHNESSRRLRKLFEN